MRKIIFSTLLTVALFWSVPQTTQAQTNPQSDPQYKDPSTALLLGVLVSGGGHLYAGETGTGAALLGIGVGAPVVGGALSGCDGFDCNFTPLYVGALASAGAWIYSVATASDAAKAANQRNGLAGLPIQVEPKLAHNYMKSEVTPESGLGVGISVKVGL